MNDEPDIEQQPFPSWSHVGGFIAGFAVAFVLFAVGAMAAKIDRLSKEEAPNGVSTSGHKAPAVSVNVWIDD